MRWRLLVAAAVLAGLGSPSAHAAPYTVKVCDGASAGVAGWVAATGGSHPAATYDECAGRREFGAVLLGGPGPTAGHAGWSFEAPEDTTLTGAELDRGFEVSGEGELAGEEYHGYSYEFRAWRRGYTAVTMEEACFGEAACTELARAGKPARWTAARPGLVGLGLAVVCRTAEGGACAPDGDDEAAALRLGPSSVTLDDGFPPAVRSVSGRLASQEPIAGRASLTATAADRGGGVAALELEVDGKVRDRATPDTATCRAPFVTAVPCPLELTQDLGFDTRSLPDGPHDVRVVASDVSGANTGSTPVWRIVTDQRGAPNGSPSSDRARLRVRWSGRCRAHVCRVRAGRAVRITGRLTARSGGPIRGAVIDVARRVAGAQRPRTARTITTGSSGRFSLRVRARTSAAYAIGYRARRRDSRPAAAVRLRLSVPGRVGLRSSARTVPRGQRFLLSGRLRGRSSGAGRRLVEVQAFDGSRWQTFATTRTRGARYRLRYRFRSGGAAARYRLRARVPAQAGWPYAAGHSRTVVVTVR